MLNKILVPVDTQWLFKKDYIKSDGAKYAAATDPDAIGYILATNRVLKGAKIAMQPQHSADSASDSISDLRLDSGLAIGLRAVYDPLKTINSSSPEMEKIAAVKEGIQSASSDLPLATSVLTREGDAGIGIPLAFTAVEKNLKVEPSLLKTYDIYWIQLAINPSEELVSRSSELRYDITIETPNCLVMAVEPLRLGTEPAETIKERREDRSGAPGVFLSDRVASLRQRAGTPYLLHAKEAGVGEFEI